MQRYFLLDQEDKITGSDAHHIKKVMRMKTGDEIIICKNNQCFIAHIKIEDEEVLFYKKEELPAENMIDITLIQGLPKGSKNEFIVKYATMFGVTKIIFTEMNRSIAKIDNDEHKLKRLYTIAKEASELSHRSFIPMIEFKKQFKQINLSEYDVVFLADENHLTTTLEEAFQNVHKNQKIALIIGPEGGITDLERDYLKNHHVIFVSLGKLILPTEAASLYALAYLSVKNS